MRIHKVLSLAATAAIFAGCSGGSSSPVAPIAHPPSSTVPAGIAKNATKFVLALPGHKGTKRYAIGSRKPKYVSPSTAGLIATVTNPDIASGAAQYQGYTLAADATASTSSPATCGDESATNGPGGTDGYTCTLFFNLAPDATAYSITLTAYDVAQSGNSGTVAGSANALSVDTETPTIAADTANVVTFTLQGIVRGFFATRQFDGVPNDPPAPTASPVAVSDARIAKHDEVAGPTPTPTPTPTAMPIATPIATPTPTTMPTSFPVTFLPLDADGNPINDSAPLAYYNGSTFVMNATFNVAVSDQHCLEAPCYGISGNSALASGQTTTFTITYNGLSDPGTPGAASNAPPGFGQVVVNAPSDYVGYSKSPSGAAATEYIEPLFPMVDQTNSLATGEATVTFTAANQTITGYGIQANMVTGSSGYTVDDSDCSNNGGTGNDIANASNLQPNLEPNINSSDVFGTSLTITAGNPTLAQGASSVSCVIRVYDDNFMAPASGIADEADIFVIFNADGSQLTVPGGSPGAANFRTRGSH